MCLRFKSYTLILMVILAFPTLAPAKESQPNVKALVQDNTAFAVDMYKKLYGTSGNIFLSPYSISTALAMTYAGAKETTREQMAKTLRFSLEPKDLDPAFGFLQSTLSKAQKGGDVSLSLANSLWPQKGYNLIPKYLKLSKKYYGVSITSLDYQDQPEEARKTINNWVKEKTHDKIRDIIPPNSLNTATKLVLANAICFKGKWERRFEADLTENAPFFISSENSIKTPMMKHTGMFKYADIKSFQILEMPYAGNKLSMIALLPKGRDGLKPLENELSTKSLNLWKNKMVPTKVLVHFPKFEITSAFNLSDTLISMGMASAFSAKDANFSGIAPRNNDPLYLSSFIHKAFVEVNEQGTQASAATLNTVQDAVSVGEPVLPVFRADHPFIFLIQENQTGAILFMGRLLEPTAARKTDTQDNLPSSNKKSSHKDRSNLKSLHK